MMEKGLSLQEAMNMLKEIDSVPKDRTLVLYTKNKGYNNADYQRLMNTVKQLNENGAVQQVIIMPYDDMELRELTDADKERLRKLLNL